MDVRQTLISMKDQIINILSQTIDKDIVKDLVNSYEKVKDEFIKGNYEEAQSKSGKFVDNVFRTLNYIITGQALKEIKPNEMSKISEKLRNANGSKYPESIRLLIPDIAQSLIYQPRSKLGSVHQKPVTPDFIDAKLTVESSDWIMAELLRQYDTRDVEKVSFLINNVVKEYIPIIQRVGDEIFVDADVKCDEEILIRLHESTNGLTRKELGEAMRHFDSSTISNSLKKLQKPPRDVFLTRGKKYVIAESTRKKISKRILELSNR